MTADPPEGAGLGRILQAARVARGISMEALALEMSLPLPLLEAIEGDDWEKVPAGRERPLARILARRLEVDLDRYAEAWAAVPGVAVQEEDPRRERVERWAMAAMTAGSILLLAWLLIPGRDIKSGMGAQRRLRDISAPSNWAPPKSGNAYPVLGEALPEAPVNDQGVLLTLRSMDTCNVHIQNDEGQSFQQTLRISEPWRLRVKGPFTLSLDNGGVVNLEVAGRRVQHGASVAQPWSGRFSEDGTWIRPSKEEETVPPTTPDTDPETPVNEE